MHLALRKAFEKRGKRLKMQVALPHATCMGERFKYFLNKGWIIYTRGGLQGIDRTDLHLGPNR